MQISFIPKFRWSLSIFPIVYTTLLMMSMSASGQQSAYTIAKDLYRYSDNDPTDIKRDEHQKRLLAELTWFNRKQSIQQVIESLPEDSQLRHYILKIYLSFTSEEAIFAQSRAWRDKNLDTTKSWASFLWKKLNRIEADSIRLQRYKRELTSSRRAIKPYDERLDSISIEQEKRQKNIDLQTDSTLSLEIRTSLQSEKKDLQDIRDKDSSARSRLLTSVAELTEDSSRLAQRLSMLRQLVLDTLRRRDTAITNFKTKHFGRRISATNPERIIESLVFQQQQLLYSYEVKTQNDASQQGLPLSFRMPSQTEMIDALAIYLAKRVKQETVLWFFETIRKSAETDGLIRDCFPETVKLLESGTIYETPNLGAAWRYALSKDFITFPEHALESRWLIKRIPENKRSILTDLKTGVTVARLVAQQYGFENIVRQLYMEQPVTNQSIINQAISLLYAVQQEMKVYRSDSLPEYRVSYENLADMPNDAFIMMLELINIRYRGCISGLLGQSLNDRSPVEYDLMRNWLGRIQLTMQQIDKSRAEFNQVVKMMDQNGVKNYDFSHYSTWNFLKEIMKNLVPEPSLSKLDSTVRLSFLYLADAQEVYAQLEKKNYSGAISLTFNLLDKLANQQEIMPELPDVIRMVSDSAAYQKSEGKFLGRIKLSQTWAETYKQGIQIMGPYISRKLDTLLYAGKAADSLKGNNRFAVGPDTIEIDNGTVRIKFGASNKQLELSNLLRISLGNDTVFTDMAAFHKRIVDNALLNRAWMESVYLQAEVSALKPLIADRSKLYYKEYYNARKTVTRLASFLNDVALTEDSKQLARVVESYAMPPGSYKRKRNVWYSVDLSAFVGGYMGWEFPLRTFDVEPAKKKDITGLVYGISAPIGITWSRTTKKPVSSEEFRRAGHYKSKEKGIYRPSGNTLSLTLSIIDPAAVVSYRLTNTRDVAPQEFKWDQIISPGLHAAWSIKGTPLVISGGAVFTPQLRTITTALPETGQINRQLNTVRTYMGIFFDLPLLNFWEQKDVNRKKWYSPKDFDLRKHISL